MTTLSPWVEEVKGEGQHGGWRHARRGDLLELGTWSEWQNQETEGLQPQPERLPKASLFLSAGSQLRREPGYPGYKIRNPRPQAEQLGGVIPALEFSERLSLSLHCPSTLSWAQYCFLPFLVSHVDPRGIP